MIFERNIYYFLPVSLWTFLHTCHLKVIEIVQEMFHGKRQKCWLTQMKVISQAVYGIYIEWVLWDYINSLRFGSPTIAHVIKYWWNSFFPNSRGNIVRTIKTKVEVKRMWPKSPQFLGPWLPPLYISGSQT